MYIDSISSENFRLLQRQTVEFSENVNVICGDNAQGKTTLLEAVYLLTGTHSFRTRFDKELIAWNADFASLDGRLYAQERSQRVELLLRRGRSRQMKLNGAKCSPAEITGRVTAVLFCPDDLSLVRGGAALRRRLLDAAISQLRPGYAALLSDFAQLYENKTRILRDWREKKSLLEPLDEFSDALCRCSARIIRYRASFARRLMAAAVPVHREFSGGGEELGGEYVTVSSVTDPEAAESLIFEEIARRQQELRQAELDSGLCLVGAHKDDLLLTVNGEPAGKYASQGQTRTAALSLKLAEREIFLAETGESPVLLLDDVLSELDSARQEFVLNRISGGQTLITCCDGAAITRLTGGRVLRVEGGRIT